MFRVGQTEASPAHTAIGKNGALLSSDQLKGPRLLQMPT